MGNKDFAASFPQDKLVRYSERGDAIPKVVPVLSKEPIPGMMNFQHVGKEIVLDDRKMVEKAFDTAEEELENWIASWGVRLMLFNIHVY
ncbi:hypothetical protein CCP3SC15_3550004 [Gammaproteobacteria bacterium]